MNFKRKNMDKTCLTYICIYVQICMYIIIMISYVQKKYVIILNKNTLYFICST